MFILLAVVFAVGFVGFGVGSGSTGIGDLFSNGKIFGLGGNSSSSGGPSVSKAQKEVAAHPREAQGYRDLSTAYQDKKQNDKAIAPLEQYTQLRPKDQDALRELAGLYLALAGEYQAAAQQAQLANPVAVGGQIFQLSGKVGTALGSDPIQSALSTEVNSAVQKQVTKLLPPDGSVWNLVQKHQRRKLDDDSLFPVDEMNDYRNREREDELRPLQHHKQDHDRNE